MVAAHHRKDPASVMKMTFFNILDPGPVDPDWHVMLRFACQRAGMTTNAVAVIYYISEIQQFLLTLKYFNKDSLETALWRRSENSLESILICNNIYIFIKLLIDVTHFSNVMSVKDYPIDFLKAYLIF